MKDKLDIIIKELKTVKEDVGLVRSELKEEVRSVETKLQTEINTLKTKFEIFETNQLTFLQELQKQSAENQNREKIFLNEVKRDLKE